MTNDRKRVQGGEKGTVRRRKRLHKILVPEFSDAPKNKIEVLLIKAEPGRPVGPGSDVGVVRLRTRSKSITVTEQSICSEKYGEIREIYLEKGDIVSGGQAFALIELFDASEFGQRSDEYEAALDWNEDIALIEYPENLKGDSPEILRRAAKLMTGLYRYWNSGEDYLPAAERIDSDFPIYLEDENENKDFEEGSFGFGWKVDRKILFDLTCIDEIDVWFEDDHLCFRNFESRFENARYQSAHFDNPYRYSNKLRWVFTAERVISEESELGDERVREIYEIIELEKGIEFRLED